MRTWQQWYLTAVPHAQALLPQHGAVRSERYESVCVLDTRTILDPNRTRRQHQRALKGFFRDRRRHRVTPRFLVVSRVRYGPEALEQIPTARSSQLTPPQAREPSFAQNSGPRLSRRFDVRQQP